MPLRHHRSNFYFAGIAALLVASSITAAAQTWSQDGPPPRYHASGVYDAVTDQMIIFGGLPLSGSTLSDVWADRQVAAAGQAAHVATTWVQLFPSGTAPVARSGHSAVYDSASNRMVVFGGTSTSSTCLNDLWILDDANSALGTPSWLAETATGTSPGVRTNHSSVYDPVSNSMIVFGGSNCASGYFSDVWVLANANGTSTPVWTKLSPTGTPPAARENASAIYDSVHNVLVIYAGDAGGNGFSDVWTLSNANGTGGTPQWTQLSPTGAAPVARTGHTAVYDSTNNRMIIFGGIKTLTGTGYLGDTWILTGANGLAGPPAWVAEKVTGTAPLRRFHTALYSSTYNSMVIFGGEYQIAQEPVVDHAFVLSAANGLP